MTRPIEREFEGKTAFVVGGSSGIGLASATLLADRGANVAIIGHSTNTPALAAELSADGKRKVIGFNGDASQADFVRQAIADTVAHFGGLDILMCSAAIHPLGNVIETDEATWDRTFAVNIKSMYLTCHYGAPHLIERGGGSIITVSSVQATSNTPNVCAYATTKGAIVTFTHTLAVDLAKHGIRANTICPGSIITPMQEHFAKGNADGRSVEEVYAGLARPVPLQRLGEASEIAELAAFLASPRSGFCTGSEFTADGGLLASLRIV
ncbi:oxidoreductase [Kaistia sp. 32K]|uniref:SDR family NAD(P)-dependent oxidoreductase n=1 Tax=Kaistia sp. 32K TaxID=2795690 RepID=UPI0019152EEF|nr:SDR family NAD(P)-dependent oxidoreductase [Kaistia sp. 32K]BCP55482.1 oxidoreductase [Kaistia sp. 32K]